MTKQNPQVLRADRLRTLLSMPAFQETVLKWIEDSHAQALHEMSNATVENFQQAQGAYRAMQQLKDQFDSVFEAERRALNSKTKEE